MKQLNDLDRKIINVLQSGFPLSKEPFAEVAGQMGIDEAELISRLQHLLENKILSRFGPMYDAQKMGGAFSLVAMKVPQQDFEKVTEVVNSYSEVAHNYQRDNVFNMWFVIATETPQQIAEVNRDIEQRSGLKTYNFPKLAEYYVGLQLPV
ncbi:MAG: AsnC family transcriptional regulator [Pseudomonadota bacterium]|nr:AsnC family transcriptional regulator [Pseudomonadota bacterium]